MRTQRLQRKILLLFQNLGIFCLLAHALLLSVSSWSIPAGLFHWSPVSNSTSCGCGSFPCSVTSDQIPLRWHRRVQQRCSHFQAQPRSRRCEVNLTPRFTLQFKSWKEQETVRQGPTVWALCSFWAGSSCPTAPNPSRSLLFPKSSAAVPSSAFPGRSPTGPGADTGRHSHSAAVKNIK